MKIDDRNYNPHLRGRNNVTSPSPSDDVKPSRQNTFEGELADFDRELVREKFDRLMEIVDERGKKLKQSLDRKDLFEYKRCVRDLLGLIQKEFARTKQSFSWDGSGNVRTYKIIDKVDENLDLLHNLFLEEQKDVLKIVSRIDEIRGLLLDLYI